MFTNKLLPLFLFDTDDLGGQNPDDKNNAGENPKKESSEEQHSDLEKLDATELVSIIKDLRSEAKSRRLKANELQSKIDEIEAKENKAKDEERKKKGEYEQLLVEKESQIAELQKKASAFDEYRSSRVESVKNTLGENWLDEYSNLSLPALEKLSQTMSNKLNMKVNVDSPTNTKKENVVVELTETDKRRALELFPGRSDDAAYDLYKQVKIEQLKRKKEKENG